MVDECISKLEQAITEIDQLDRSECLDRWRDVFGRPPPKHLSPQFMKRVLTWELQCRMLDSVSAKTERRLKRIASGKTPSVQAKPGSHLVREWNGRTYQVEVINGGYVMDGKVWRSLSAIARHITGARWVGSALLWSSVMQRIRCAIYTRKSSEEGLEQEFNSLDAQREACAAYIASQKHEGWELLPDRYDDGGISGGHLERPALKQLMQAVDEKRIDQIVVYKIDRLTRSLADFAKLVDRLDAAGTSFVSVTQSFNTATSMGRLTLHASELCPV